MSNQHQQLTNHLESAAKAVRNTPMTDDEREEIVIGFMAQCGYEKQQVDTIASYSHDDMDAGMELKTVDDKLHIEFRFGDDVDYRSIPTVLEQIAAGLAPIFHKLETENRQ